MRFSLLVILASLSFLGCQSMRSKNSNMASAKTEGMIKKSRGDQTLATANNKMLAKKSIYEELTGQKVTAQSAAQRVLQMARESKAQKNYVTALKRYNTLIVRYPKASEVREAYLDKSVIYKELGLHEQANYNYDIAMKMTPQTSRRILNKQSMNKQNTAKHSFNKQSLNKQNAKGQSKVIK